MARFIVIGVLAAIATGVKVTQDPMGGLAGMMGGGGNPLAGMIPAGGIPGMPGTENITMEDVMDKMNKAVVALKDKKTNATAFKFLADMETESAAWLIGAEADMDTLAARTSNVTDDADFVAALAVYTEKLINTSSELADKTMAKTKSDIMPILPSEMQTKALPMLIMGKGGLKAMTLMTLNKMRNLSNMSIGEVCGFYAPWMHPVKGMPALAKNLTRDLPKIEGSRSMLPMALPFISGQHPEMMPTVAKLASLSIDSSSRIGRQLEKNTNKFMNQVAPILTQKLRCVFKADGTAYSKKHGKGHSSAAAASGPGSLLLLLAAAWAVRSW